MRGSLLATASAAAFVFLPTAASAQAASQSQDDVDAETETVEEISPAAKAGEGKKEGKQIRRPVWRELSCVTVWFHSGFRRTD